jgi:predicted PurR-regulated permease PerM
MGANTALLIAGYSIVVISIVADTFVKPVIIRMIKDQLLHEHTRVNEIVIFFSIVAGMSTYGFWGMILGPAITTFLFAATRIYLEYSSSIDT